MKKLREIISTDVGAAVYAKQAKRVHWLSYIEAAEKGIKDIAHNGYDEKEVAAFKAHMGKHVQSLKLGGFNVFAKKKQTVAYQDQPMTQEITNANDEWNYRMSAEIKVAALNSGALTRMPWEVLLWGENKPIPGGQPQLRCPKHW